MSTLNINERRNGSVVILDLKGNIRIGKDNLDIHQALRQLVEKGEKNVLINLAEVNHIDSSGLGELVAGYTTLQKSDGNLKLLNLTLKVNELMMITKLLTVFEVFENEAEAVKSFDNSSAQTADNTD